MFADAQGPLPRRIAALDTVQGCRQYVALVQQRRQRRQRNQWLCHALAALAATLAVCEGASGSSWALLLAVPALALGWCAGRLLQPRRAFTRAEYLSIPDLLANLRDAIERVLLRFPGKLKEAARQASETLQLGTILARSAHRARRRRVG